MAEVVEKPREIETDDFAENLHRRDTLDTPERDQREVSI
jgi:hypothetical protein